MKMTMRMNLAIMAAGLLCAGLIFGTDASAADMSACSEDIAKFCPNVKPGTTALLDCLEKYENELTPACKAQEAAMENRRAERGEMVRERSRFRQACGSDMAKFCADASPRRGGMISCLNDHQTELSVACSQSIKAMVE